MPWVEFFSKINKRPGKFIPESRVCDVSIMYVMLRSM